MDQSLTKPAGSRIKKIRKLQLAGGGFLGKEEKQELGANQWHQIHDYLDTNQVA